MKPVKCFAKRGRIRCDCLREQRCLGYDMCPFYKGEAQHRADINAAYMHLRRLPPEVQRAIADQYYRGKMPWALPATPPALREKPLRF